MQTLDPQWLAAAPRADLNAILPGLLADSSPDSQAMAIQVQAELSKRNTTIALGVAAVGMILFFMVK